MILFFAFAPQKLEGDLVTYFRSLSLHLELGHKWQFRFLLVPSLILINNMKLVIISAHQALSNPEPIVFNPFQYVI